MLCITEQFMGRHVIHYFIPDYVFHLFTSEIYKADGSLIYFGLVLLPVL